MDWNFTSTSSMPSVGWREWRALITVRACCWFVWSLQCWQLQVYQYNKLVRWNRSKTNVLFDLHYSKAVKPQQANASAYVETLKSKGAVLADESGLGKTVEGKSWVESTVLSDSILTVIGLILSSPSEQLPEFDENGLFNTKASLGKSVVRFTFYFVNDTFIVICPNHLAMQWSQEVSKYTDLKVSMLSFQRDLKTVTYNDIIDSGKSL